MQPKKVQPPDKVRKFRVDCTVKTRIPEPDDIDKKAIKSLLESKFTDDDNFSVAVHKCEKV